MTSLVGRLIDNLGKPVLREQGPEFLDIRSGWNIKLKIKIPNDDSFVPLFKLLSKNDWKSCRNLFIESLFCLPKGGLYVDNSQVGSFLSTTITVIASSEM